MSGVLKLTTNKNDNYVELNLQKYKTFYGFPTYSMTKSDKDSLGN